MRTSFIFWSFIMILCLIITGVAIRCLALDDVSLGESLVMRGLVCLSIVLFWGHYSQTSLIPKSVRTQVYRALIAGLALTFFSLSYKWLSASIISVLSNIDVPLIIILGTVIGQYSSLKAKLLSAMAIILLVIYGFMGINTYSQWFCGLISLSAALLLLCFGYHFIKKSMTEENRAIAILTPSIAIIIYGLAQMSGDQTSFLNWNHMNTILCLISGVGMFGAYYATMKLYDITDIATAEFPTLISSLAIQPIESFIFNEPLPINLILLTVAFIICIFFILKMEHASSTNEVTLEF